MNWGTFGAYTLNTYKHFQGGKGGKTEIALLLSTYFIT